MAVGGDSKVSGDSVASPLGDRYKVIKELGKGTYGPTYLAQSVASGATPCVVKPFVPQISDKATLARAKELFEREATALYQLNHKQLPVFQPLLQVNSEAGSRLFLVREYVAGLTYHQLIKERKAIGGQISETEITQLLYQLLPVLSFIHERGIIHRDISPDNLVLCQKTGLPTLIDFGSVKEIAAAVRSQFGLASSAPAVNRIGKIGYVPQEQLSTGNVDKTSDLYSLAATLLVLFTGKDPQSLHNPYQGTWSGLEKLSPKLGQVLSTMLSERPENRFQSADDVINALNSETASVANGVMGAGAADTAPEIAVPKDFAPEGAASAGAPPEAVVPEGVVPEGVVPEDVAVMSDDLYTEGPIGSGVVDSETVDYDEAAPAVAMTAMGAMPEDPSFMTSTYETTANESNVYESEMTREGNTIIRPESRQALTALLILLGTVGTILLFGWLRLARSPRNQVADNLQPELIEALPVNDDGRQGNFYPEELNRRQEIQQRREALGLEPNTFDRLVDQLFYDKYPNLLKGGPDDGRQALTDAPEDEPLRIRWDNIALNLLDELEGNFTRSSLAGVGSYSEDDLARWQSQVNQVNVSDEALYDLVDAKFSALFPGQAGSDFLREPIGQLYYAIAENQAGAIAQGTRREDVVFSPNVFSQDLDGQLQPGEGMVYTLDLTAGQLLRLNVNAPSDSTLLSVYLPENAEDDIAIITDSEQTTWSGAVDYTGYYEVVVVNRSNEAIDYQLAVAVDNVTLEPPVAPEREELPPIPEDEVGETDADDADASDETTAEESLN